MADDDLADFERDAFRFDGKQRTVFRQGAGPAVIVMSEVPGITPKVAAFARRVAAIGCTAVMPHLFGTPGKDPVAGGRLGTTVLRPPDARAAVREQGVHDLGDEPDLAGDRRGCGRWRRTSTTAAAAPASAPSGCASPAGSPSAMATHPSILAPVLSQPSMPMAVTKRQRRLDRLLARRPGRGPRAGVPPRGSRSSACASAATRSCPTSASRSSGASSARRSSPSSSTTTPPTRRRR